MRAVADFASAAAALISMSDSDSSDGVEDEVEVEPTVYAETTRFLIDAKLQQYEEAMALNGYDCIFEVKALGSADRDVMFARIGMTKIGHVKRFEWYLQQIIMLPRKTLQPLPANCLFYVSVEVGFNSYPQDEVCEYLLCHRSLAEINAAAARTSDAAVHGGQVYLRRVAQQLKAVIGGDYGKKRKFTSGDAAWLYDDQRAVKRTVKTRAQCDAYDMRFIDALESAQMDW